MQFAHKPKLRLEAAKMLLCWLADVFHVSRLHQWEHFGNSVNYRFCHRCNAQQKRHFDVMLDEWVWSDAF